MYSISIYTVLVGCTLHLNNKVLINIFLDYYFLLLIEILERTVLNSSSSLEYFGKKYMHNCVIFSIEKGSNHKKQKNTKIQPIAHLQYKNIIKKKIFT